MTRNTGFVRVHQMGSEKYGVFMKRKRSLLVVDCKTVAWILLVAGMLLNGNAWANQAGVSSSEAQHVFYMPKYISVEAVIAYASQLPMGRVIKSHQNGAACVQLSGGQQGVSCLLDVLDIVDSSHAYSIQLVDQSTGTWTDGLNRTLQSRLGNVSIGTLMNPPAKASGSRVIIDQIGYRDASKAKVLVIAPSLKISKIADAIQHGIGSDFQMLAEVKDTTTSPSGKVTFDAGRLTDTNRLTEVNPTPSMSLEQVIRPRASDEPVSHVKDYHTPSTDNGEQMLDLNLPETLPIIMLLEFVGEHLKLDFMYDPKTVTGDVSLKLQGDLRGQVRVKDLYPMLESVLKFRGLAMTRKGQVIQVVASSDVFKGDPTLVTDGGVLNHGEAVVTRVFRLNHIDTASAENLLSTMDLGMKPVSIAESKTLIITAYAYRMPRIERLLDLVDQPGEPKLFRTYSLRYTMAKALTEKVKALAEQLNSVNLSISSTPRIPPVTKRAGESPAAFAARQRAATAAASRARTAIASRSMAQPVEEDSVYLDADERTNSVLMIGLEEKLQVVEELIETLDVEQKDLRLLKVYNIEFIDAEDAMMKLEQLGIIRPEFDTSRSQRLTNTPRVSGAKPTTSQTAPSSRSLTNPYGVVDPDALREEPQIVVIEPTNSLLVNATAEQHEKIHDIIEHVDREITNKAIDYIIYPLQNQKPEELATVLRELIEKTVQDKDGKVEQVVKKTDDDIEIVHDEKTNSIIVYANTRNQKWIKNLITTLDKRRPQVLIDVTLVEVSESDAFDYDLNVIQSFPSLAATSGATGPIMAVAEGSTSLIERLTSSGKDRFIDFQSDSGSGTGFYGDQHINLLLKAMHKKNYGRVLAKPKILVADNQEGIISTTDTTYIRTEGTTVGAGAQTPGFAQSTVTYDPYEAGIEMTIMPHISEGDLLQLEITLTRSDFIQDSAGSDQGPPNTSSSDITTVVTVPDKSTIILGGMVKLNQSKGSTKVPLLGDLPLIGSLFRGVGNSDDQKKLYIFVKAEIIRPTDVLAAGESDLERISKRNREAFEQHEAKFQNFQSWPGLDAKPMAPDRVLDAR